MDKSLCLAIIAIVLSACSFIVPYLIDRPIINTLQTEIIVTNGDHEKDCRTGDPSVGCYGERYLGRFGAAPKNQKDEVQPQVSISINPLNPDTSQTVTFSVTANDNKGGTGISEIRLYIDDCLVSTWTTAGTHSYEAVFFTQGTHTCYVEATDNANNNVKEPNIGRYEFYVSLQHDVPVFTWQLFLIGSIVVSIAVVLYIKYR